MIKVLSIILLMVLLTAACVNHDFPSYTCTNDAVSFTADVRPIIVSKCALSGCHDGGSPLGPDYNWNDFDKIHLRAESGILKFNVTNRIMPPDNSPQGPLSQDQINIIACWVDQGAQNN